MDYFDNWKSYVGKIFETYPGSVIYIKGGATIEFLLSKDFNIFQTNLFNDFDFVLENEQCCTDYFYITFF